MPGKFRDQVDIRTRLVENNPVHIAHIVVDEFQEMFKARFWLASIRELNHYTQSLLPLIASVAAQYILLTRIAVKPIGRTARPGYGTVTPVKPWKS